MPYQNNYWKTLLGLNAEVIIGKGVQYTDDATYNAFVDNAAEGEVGIFNAATGGAYYDGINTDVPAATDEVFIAVKRDSKIERSVPFIFGNVKATRTAYTAPVKQVTTLVVGALTPAAGEEFGIKILETTPGYQPFPTFNWSVVAVAGEAIDTLMARLVTAINSTSSKANKDRDLIVTAGYTDGTNTLLLTAKEFGQTFRVQLVGELAESGAATLTYTTPANIGSGTPAQTRLLQDAGDVYKGVTTNYPLQGATPSDFGKPTDFVSDAVGYNYYVIAGSRDEVSKTPHHVHTFNRVIIVAVPSTGASAEEEVKAIFGL